MKSEIIVRELRQQIVKGNLKTGERIPHRSELVSNYKVSLGTIQRAINILINDGFLISKGAFGTQVSETPPHLHCYGLAIPQAIPENCDSFWLTMAATAEKFNSEGRIKFNVYRGVVNDDKNSDYQRLIYDISSNCISGLILLGAGNIRNRVFIENPSIPIVLFEETLYDPGLSSVCCDMYSFIDKSIEKLALCGRKNIAILSGVHLSSEHLSHFYKKLKEAGLSSKPQLSQAIGIDRYSLPWVKNLVHLMMQGVNGERPDGLIIANENHLPFAAEGIAMSGLLIGNDIDVIAHANFPLSQPSPVGVLRIGFDCRTLLHTCIKNITEIKNGKRPGFVRKVAAVEEKDIK